jgi:hypothetical protein
MIVVMPATAWTMHVPAGGTGFPVGLRMRMIMIMGMIMTATGLPFGVMVLMTRVVVLTGFWRGGLAHDLNRGRDCSHGQSASIPNPAA